MARQALGFLRWVEKDRQWMAREYERFQWDLVISDNRYGFYHPRAENVLITHQLFPRSGKAWFPDGLLAAEARRLIRPFQRIWVPDIAGNQNLSGALSHPAPGKPWDSRVAYIGPLSRFSMHPEKQEEGWLDSLGLTEKGFILAVVSGPEPQRSIMESRILDTYPAGTLPLVLLRGLPAANANGEFPEGVVAFNHLDTARFQLLARQASAIVCRSGYSTIMDLVCLGRPALLVPTPGQTEQEYLAQRLSEMGLFSYLSQQQFTMPAALSRLKADQALPPTMDFLQHRAILHPWLARLAGKNQPLP